MPRTQFQSINNYFSLYNEEKYDFCKNEKRKRIDYQDDYEENFLVCKIEKRRRTADFKRGNPGTEHGEENSPLSEHNGWMGRESLTFNDIYGGGRGFSTFNNGHTEGLTFNNIRSGGSTINDIYGGGRGFSTFNDIYGVGRGF